LVPPFKNFIEYWNSEGRLSFFLGAAIEGAPYYSFWKEADIPTPLDSAIVQEGSLSISKVGVYHTLFMYIIRFSGESFSIRCHFFGIIRCHLVEWGPKYIDSRGRPPFL